MAVIKISELRPAGSELFQDSESFLNELANNNEVDQVLGGGLAFFSLISANANTLLAVTFSNIASAVGEF